jgi:hypothetical protein
MSGDLAEFLLARIAEDETVARRAETFAVRRTTRSADGAYGDPIRHVQTPNAQATRIYVAWAVDSDGWSPSESGTHEGATALLERYGPARVLAECEAKRRIVAEHDDQHSCTSWELASAEPYVGCSVLRLLALPYADHPDYREEWRV